MSKLRSFLNNGDVGRFRFWFQLAAFVFFIYGGYLYIDLGNSLPTFSCPFNADGKPGVCYVYAIQHQFHIPWGQIISWRGLGILTGFLTFLAWLLVFNKAWCGYACPLGTVQDWITKLRQKMGIAYSTYSEGGFEKLKKVKYILLVLLLLIPLGMSNSLLGLPKFSSDLSVAFCKLCPSRTVLPVFTGDLSQFHIDFSTRTSMVMTTLGLIVTGGFFVGAFVKKRFFCFFCPMSALHYLCNKFAFLRLTKDGSKCTRCGDCYRACDVRIKAIADDVESTNIVKDDCMMCFKCVAACPEKGALEVKFLNVPLYTSTDEGFIKRQQKYSEEEKS
ncbi:MAG: 4Fe-4S binding protein [Nitrospirota bacterium]|nr:4Fe-4S binding protein [Nitrospirota bacterium]